MREKPVGRSRQVVNVKLNVPGMQIWPTPSRRSAFVYLYILFAGGGPWSVDRHVPKQD